VRLILKCLIITCLLFFSSPLLASVEPLNFVRSATIDDLLERAISSSLIAGGVVVVGNHDGILYTTARGRLNDSPVAPLLNEQTIFDIASLTKVIATAPAIMKLLDEGRITLLDPLTRWFPEFIGTGRENITILNLLTHTSGLDDVELSATDAMKSAIRKTAEQKCHYRPGRHFHYADINFILLGELVQRVSGTTLDRFCRDQLYGPLAAHDTMFLPPIELAATIAPTGRTNSGIVQDPNSRRLDGVAGHAGLFSSAADLARFARMILGGGAIDGLRILSEQVVSRMTTPYYCSEGTVIRGLGWDMDSPFSSPKGSLFSKGSFGHTGYSGSSIWIDPRQDLFVILLTTRLNYRDTGIFNRLRRDISTVAATDFRPLIETLPTPQSRLVVQTGPDLLRFARGRHLSQAPRHALKRTAQLHKKGPASKRAQHRIGRSERRLAKTWVSKHAMTGKRPS
jgi:CubicO group peptidase (beta-lactamase class C family)